MSEKGYLVAWLIYLCCSVGLLVCFWFVTRLFYDWLRVPLTALAAVFLLLPWTAASTGSQLAPAWLAALFDTLLKPDVSFNRAGIPLVAAMLVVVLLCLFVSRLKRRAA